MNIKQYKILNWAFQSLSSNKIEQHFLKATNFEEFLALIQQEILKHRNLKSKKATQALIESVAYDKILKIKDAGKTIKSYKRRTKSTKAKILERFAEITALRNGGTYNGKTIPKCSWTEILLFLRQKGIHTTEQYLRSTYTTELAEMNKKYTELL